MACESVQGSEGRTNDLIDLTHPLSYLVCLAPTIGTKPDAVPSANVLIITLRSGASTRQSCSASLLFAVIVPSLCRVDTHASHGQPVLQW